MRHLTAATDLTGPDLTDDELRALHAYPTEPDRAWVRVNLVASVDGAVSVAGTSAGLSSPGDMQLFGLLRELCDVVLVGAGTVRDEDYRGVRTSERRRTARAGRGQSAVPPVAVVTAGARLDPHSRLFTDTTVAPLVLTTEDADPGRTHALAAAGADVLVVGDDRVDPVAALDALAGRGLHRVLCEGGPGLFGDLVLADRVDELCLTTAPVLAAGQARRIAASATSTLRRMRPAHVLTDDEGALFTRWVRQP